METYRGLAILTTNMKKALDQAFSPAPLRGRVPFPRPQGTRGDLRIAAFRHRCPCAIDFGLLAQPTVSGGSIRNIALSPLPGRRRGHAARDAVPPAAPAPNTSSWSAGSRPGRRGMGLRQGPESPRVDAAPGGSRSNSASWCSTDSAGGPRWRRRRTLCRAEPAGQSIPACCRPRRSGWRCGRG